MAFDSQKHGESNDNLLTEPCFCFGSANVQNECTCRSNSTVRESTSRSIELDGSAL